MENDVQTGFKITFRELMQRLEDCETDMHKQNELNITSEIIAEHFPELSASEKQHLLEEYLHHEASTEVADLTAFHEACKGLLGDQLNDDEV